jgi:Protein of unknown function (DUF3175)
VPAVAGFERVAAGTAGQRCRRNGNVSAAFAHLCYGRNRPAFSGIAVLSRFRVCRMKKKSAKAQRKAHHKQATRKPATSSRRPAAPREASLRWSADVSRRSDALDLEKGVFTRNDPREIAASLKRSAEASLRKKSDSFRSAMSLLSFYINRAGANLSDMRRRILTRAKDELRRQFGRGP